MAEVRKPRTLQERLQAQLESKDAFTLRVDLLGFGRVAQLSVAEVGKDFVEGKTPNGDICLIPLSSIMRIKVEVD